MAELSRIRIEKDGSETLFHEAEHAGRYRYRAEIALDSIDDVRQFARDGRLVAVRMAQVGAEEGRRPQVNLVGRRQINGL